MTRMYVPIETEGKLELPVHITCRLLLSWEIHNLEVLKGRSYRRKTSQSLYDWNQNPVGRSGRQL